MQIAMPAHFTRPMRGSRLLLCTNTPGTPAFAELS